MSILSDAKNLYHFFYNGKYWSEEKATDFFIDKDNSSARTQVVKTIYSVIFRSNKIDKSSLTLVLLLKIHFVLIT